LVEKKASSKLMELMKESEGELSYLVTTFNGTYYNIYKLCDYCDKYNIKFDDPIKDMEWIIPYLKNIIELLEVRVKMPDTIHAYPVKEVLKKKMIDNLNDTFKGREQYESIITRFIQMGLIDPDTLIWRDRRYEYKSILASYLKNLQVKGYTGQLTDDEIQKIAQNSFGVEIGISTIQHTEPDGIPKLSKIPPFLAE
jgi:hypothetical protein